jgi:SecD/SecF fusion protein
LVGDESTEADATVETKLREGISKYQKGFEIMGSSKVGATIADDIIYTSYWSLLLSLAGIFLYVFVRFRKWQFGLGGVVALIHDALVVIALYSIAGLFGLNLEVDQIFVAAILTIVGYSINDTVVVFDRVRETMKDNPKMDLAQILNTSLNNTFSRTVVTALTVLLVVVILLFFGGEILRGFSFAMVVGVIVGTYSSIFIAVPMVLDLKSKDKSITLNKE